MKVRQMIVRLLGWRLADFLSRPGHTNPGDLERRPSEAAIRRELEKREARRNLETRQRQPKGRGVYQSVGKFCLFLALNQTLTELAALAVLIASAAIVALGR